MSETSFRRHPLQAEPCGIQVLADRLGEADAVTLELMWHVIGEACWRLPSLRRTRDYDLLQRLIRSGAWIDAALALLGLELPQWQLRRIAYDDGKWYCVLSRQRAMPNWLDQSIEAHHADLALAILSAFVDAQRDRALPARPSVPSVPRTDDACYVRLCCDNFS
jgi:hypothetical protein